MPRAFVGIEPAFRQKHPHRVDAVLQPVQRGELQGLESEALEHLEPALADAELLGPARRAARSARHRRDLTLGFETKETAN
jgi:hypothetical protein